MDVRPNQTKAARDEVLIQQARLTNAQRDADERSYGFAALSDTEPFEILRTAAWAVKAGLARENWPAVAEGYVMLEDGLMKLGEWR